MKLEFPLRKPQLVDIATKYPTPFHIYDEANILRNSKNLYKTMQDSYFKDFFNYFAVKVLPNPHIMRVVVDSGQGVDCSSLAELELAAMIGLKGDQIIFTPNNTTMAEYERAQELGATINFDDISYIKPFLKELGTPEIACCRYNPGNVSFEDSEEWIMGRPSEAKFGMTKPQIIEAYELLKQAGVKRFGLHTMLLSNDLDWQNHYRIADLLFELASEISQKLSLNFSFIDLGGGIGVPYRPDEQAFDISTYAAALQEGYQKHGLAKHGAPRIVMENGRYMTADAGYLVTRAINIKNTHKRFIGVDASMSNLMRPGIYGAHHEITVLGKESAEPTETVDVTGSLCENNDKFAVDRLLPPIEVGDYLVIHTSGAHGHAMGFQYNGKLRSAELLLKADGKVECIRRAETLDDYFATLSGSGIPMISNSETK